jgi:uncharacterized protein (DUF1697 family)
MTKYVAFLRAINVGGRIIKMEELREILESLKLKNVKTYIQTGNIIFESSVKTDILREKIEKKLKSSLGYEVKVMLRTHKELSFIVKNNPYKNKEIDKNTRVYIAFLYKTIKKGIKAIIASLNNENETYVSIKKEVYCLIHKDEKKGSYFSILLLEKNLGIPLTTRNQTTVNKIKIMLDS